MAGRGQLLGLAGRVLAVLLVLGTYSGADIADPAGPGIAAPVPPVADRALTPAGPAVVDTNGARLKEEHADVVRSVHRGLVAGDLDALGGLYAGDDWAGQASLLAQAPVRRSVLDVLGAHPANLGEGYLYPGFSVDPTTDYRGYQTAFFLDYDPPRTATGPLRWRGIAVLAPAPPA